MSFNSKIRNDVIIIFIMCYLAQHKQYFHENSHTMRAYVIWRRHHRAWIGWCRVIPMLPKRIKRLRLKSTSFRSNIDFTKSWLCCVRDFGCFLGEFLLQNLCGKAFRWVVRCNDFVVLLVFADRKDTSLKVVVHTNGKATAIKLSQADLVFLLRYEYSFVFAFICFLKNLKPS